jgi:hypothetical protein
MLEQRGSVRRFRQACLFIATPGYRRLAISKSAPFREDRSAISLGAVATIARGQSRGGRRAAVRTLI